ncbi:MAG TPA: hypothetical protein VNU46_00830 [Gemmatimonadaceae bacterium]|nr:hypothetical protein [Gemmatimonadaceae bacterium]
MRFDLVGLLASVLALGGGWGSLEAQRVVLRIHPHVGDTLHMKLDQRFEMTGESSPASPPSSHANSAAPSPASPGAPPAAATPEPGMAMAARMQICTHTVVLRATTTGTELQSITDSVSFAPVSAAAIPIFAQTKRALQGRMVRLHIGIDGGITVSDPSGRAPDPASPAVMLAQIPALLPGGPVQMGDSWVRELLLPLSATQTTTGLVRITFRLDSLGPDATIAYISMHGTFSHDHGRDSSGTRDHTLGTLTGTMQVDRRLEWLTDSRTTVTLTSTVTPPGGTSPVRVHVKITQWLRAVPGA